MGAALIIVIIGSGCGNGGVKSTNQPPSIPIASTVGGAPGIGAIGTGLNPTLRWRSDDPEGQALKYDLYFGSSPLPPLIDSGLNKAEYRLTALECATTYYWRVVACDPEGLCTPSTRWHFTTVTSEEVPIYTDPAAPIVIEAGESFRIELMADLDLHRLWSWIEPIDRDLVDLVEQTFHSHAGQTFQAWRLKTSTIGRTTLSLALLQEGSTAPLDVAHFELIIY